MDREMMLHTWKDEVSRTGRVLAAFADTALGFSPHPRSQSVGAIVATMVPGLRLAGADVLGGAPRFTVTTPPAIASLRAGIEALDAATSALAHAAHAASADWNSGAIDVPMPNGLVVPIPRPAMLTMLLHDHIHHRGQLSVYLRLSGGLVPSIYGPSADSNG